MSILRKTAASSARRTVVVALCAASAAGCVITGRDLDRRYAGVNDDPARILVCHGYGCDDRQEVSLSAEEWRDVVALFTPPAETAADERARVAAAIGRMETFIGVKTGTAGDQARSAVFTFDARGQMDCLDESTNTTRYLRLFAAQGLLRFHAVGAIAYRGRLIDGLGPHNAATLQDIVAGQEFAVDSWFHVNGQPAEIMPLDDWRHGWRPAKSAPPAGE
ncbi:MAG: hypothetical protein H3C28_10805 [Sphingomonadales bacterium]|nr:hypothetical protein [Sphingomonadales bacterium]